MGRRNRLILVVTGDVEGSKNSARESKEILLEGFSLAEKTFPDLSMSGGFRIYRGDGFQGAFSSVEQGVCGAFFFFAFFRSRSRQLGVRKASVRMGIGIGTGVVENGNVLESTGEAFQLSGAALDELEERKKDHEPILFRTPWEIADRLLATEARLVGDILDSWTETQARSLVEAFQGRSQKKIADMMGVGQSNVSRLLKNASFRQVRDFCSHVETLADYVAKNEDKKERELP